MNRFTFEIVERYVDEWVYAEGVNPRFKRVYAKFKMLLVGSALIDYLSECGEDHDCAVAKGWEHVQVALAGHAAEDMSGMLTTLYRLCEDREGLRATFEEGFRRAIEATPTDHRWLFRPKYRNKPFRSFEEGFNLGVAIPTFGPLLREWAGMQGMSEDKVELAVELLMREYGELAEAKPKPHIRLL